MILADSEEEEDTTLKNGNKSEGDIFSTFTEADEEAEKKKADALWAEFMSDETAPKKPDTSTPGTSVTSTTTVSKSGVVSTTIQLTSVLERDAKKEAKSEAQKSSELKTESNQSSNHDNKTESNNSDSIERLFATGDNEENSSSGDAKNSETSLRAISQQIQKTETNNQAKTDNNQETGIKRPAIGGLGSVLSQIKKSKTSTLEKSKQEWGQFKKEEGLEEELDQHNRSKDAYVERQAFLLRADLRQFENEREIRERDRARRGIEKR